LVVAHIKPKINRYTFGLALILYMAASSLLLSSCSNQDARPDPEPEAREQPAEQESELELPCPDQQEQGNRNNGDLEQGEKCNNMEVDPGPELPRVGLYTGKGSWKENVEVAGNFLDHYEFEWSSFEENEAVSLDLENHYDLLWFPGGFAAEYKHYINDHSNIRDFVSDGGLFIGSCAGAYYASDILRWQGTDYEYPLHLFDGKGVGPLAGQIGWGETGIVELEEGHPVNQGFNLEKEMYYFDGPYFEPYDNDSVTVLARYQVNSEPAIIAGSKGAGKYLLLGPHPEIGGYSAESPDFSPDGEGGAQWPWLYRAVVWLSQK